MGVQAFGGDVFGPNGNLIPITPAIRSNGLILMSGQLAMREGKIVGASIEEQTDAAIDNIAALLDSLGRSLSDVVKVTAWLTRAEDFAGFNAAYGRRFARPFPVRSTVVSQLLIPGALVEIEATATAE